MVCGEGKGRGCSWGGRERVGGSCNGGRGGGGASNAVHEERLGNIFRKNGSHPGLNQGPLTLAVSALPPELWPRAHVVLILSLRNSNEACMRGSTVQYNTSQHHKA